MAVCLEGWAAIFYLKKNKQRTDFLTRKRFDIRAMYSRVSVEPERNKSYEETINGDECRISPERDSLRADAAVFGGRLGRVDK
jgi:hypothetical protein